MRLSLDFHGRIPIYVQIVEQVKAMAAAGLLRPGDQLPTVREVASDLRINFNTVARAYRLLHEEGVISTQQGRGTFLMAKEPIPGKERERRERLRGLAQTWLEEASRLGFSLSETQQAFLEMLARRAERTREG